MDKQALRKELEKHRIVDRLLKNPNWELTARAAIDKLVDGKECPVKSWPRSSTWQQVQMAFDQIKNR
jgi:hypothetical protein